MGNEIKGASPDEVLIEARGLVRRYGPTIAVNGLDLTLRKGEIVGLLGPNGAGKSTTMKMLTGNLAPSAAIVKIKGVSLRDQIGRQTCRDRVCQNLTIPVFTI